MSLITAEHCIRCSLCLLVLVLSVTGAELQSNVFIEGGAWYDTAWHVYGVTDSGQVLRGQGDTFAEYGRFGAKTGSSWSSQSITVGDSGFLVRDYRDERKAAFMYQPFDPSVSAQRCSLSFSGSGASAYGLQNSFRDSVFYVSLHTHGIAAVSRGSGRLRVDSVMHPGGQTLPGKELSAIPPVEGDSRRVLSVNAQADTLWATTFTDTVWYHTPQNQWEYILPRAGYDIIERLTPTAGEPMYYALRGDTTSTDSAEALWISAKDGQNVLPAEDVESYACGSSALMVLTDTMRFTTISNGSVDSLPALSNAFARFVDTQFVIKDPQVYDMDWSLHEGKKRLVLATSRGLVYTDAFETTPQFHIQRQDRPISGGLKEVYAQPSILNDRFGRVVFTYSLSRADRVSIDIFDANMDYVCSITDREARPAGGAQHSTNPAEDSWDGTRSNRGGEMVSPGVYYFRITTEEGGERAFGTVVVAKN
ncbi:MAG: hypothetical protein ACQEQV_04985 [Fibrobacterota bacterium]